MTTNNLILGLLLVMCSCKPQKEPQVEEQSDYLIPTR